MHMQIRHLLIRLTCLFDYVNLQARNLLVFITYSYHIICIYRLGKPNSSFGYTVIGLLKLLRGQWHCPSSLLVQQSSLAQSNFFAAIAET